MRLGRKGGILPLKKQDKMNQDYLRLLSRSHVIGMTELHSESVTSVTLASHTIVVTMATFLPCILVYPPLSNAGTAHRPTRISEDPIYFYDSDKPYFELAKLL